MFDSALTILDKYIDTDKLSRFTFYSLETARGENLEDLYYLCTVKDHYYVVFETDYILNTLMEVAQEAADIFREYDLVPLYWMVKKDAQGLVGGPTISIDADNIDDVQESLVSDRTGSASGYAVRYAVMEFTKAKGNSVKRRFDPIAYGGGS